MSLRLHSFDELNGHPAKVGLGLVFDFDEEPFVGLLAILNPIPSDGVGSAQGASHAADYAGNRVAVAAETRPLYDAPVWIPSTQPEDRRYRRQDLAAGRAGGAILVSPLARRYRK